MIFLPIIIAIQFIFSLGLLLITSSVDVYVRDAEYIINFIVNMLFYATPILYSPTLFANSPISWIFKVNPMAMIITGYRDILFNQVMPNFVELAIAGSMGIIIFIIGVLVFRKLERGFAEEV
jgi:ABC-type polysaccharide/polyol phosphate export permease